MLTAAAVLLQDSCSKPRWACWVSEALPYAKISECIQDLASVSSTRAPNS
jgi:hypothetical protein